MNAQGMVGYSVDGLRDRGFDGFVGVARIRQQPSLVPSGPGVYIVVRDHDEEPIYLDRSPAFWFKGSDPTVPIESLRSRWVAQTSLLYVGKADAGAAGGRGLRTRVGELVAFGAGERAAHWGGRYLWQLAGSSDHLVAWFETADPVDLENELLVGSMARFGRYPFANIAGPRRSRRP